MLLLRIGPTNGFCRRRGIKKGEVHLFFKKDWATYHASSGTQGRPSLEPEDWVKLC